MPEFLQDFITKLCYEKFNIKVSPNENLINEIGEYRLVEISDLRLTIIKLGSQNDICYYCKIDYDDDKQLYIIDYIVHKRNSIHYTA